MWPWYEFVGAYTRERLTTVENTFNWKDGQNVWHKDLLSENDYTYDSAGNRLTNTITDSSGNQRTESYGYDALNRLTSVNYGDGETRSYAFDNMGNRTSLGIHSGGIFHAEQDQIPQCQQADLDGPGHETADLHLRRKR